MDFARWKEKLIHPAVELFGKLSPSQRASLGILGGVVVVGLAVLIFTTPSSGRMVALAGSRPEPEFIAFLEDEQIPHETSPRGEVMVPQRSIGLAYAQVSRMAGEGDEKDWHEWVYEAVSLQESSGRAKMKWQIAQKRTLESALRTFDEIARATITAEKKSDWGVLRRPEQASSASVHLVLKGGVVRLSRKHARTVGLMVARGLGLRLRQVAITDSRGNSYDLSASSAQLDEEENGREAQMKAKIQDLVEGEFPPGDFKVFIHLNLNRESVNERRKAFDVDASAKIVKEHSEEESSGIVPGASGPGVQPNVARLNGASGSGTGSEYRHKRSEDRFETGLGNTETDKSIPPGGIRTMSIILKLSTSAIVEIIKAGKEAVGIEDYKPSPDELRQEIDTYLKGWEKTLQNAPSLPPDAVTAQVIAFQPPRRATALLEPGGDGVLGFARDHFRELALSLLALLGCFFLYRVASGGLPEMEQLPDPVAELERFLREKGDQLQRTGEETQEQEPVKKVEWKVSSEDQQAMNLMETITDFAQTRPEITASVLRQWIREKPPEEEQ